MGKIEEFDKNGSMALHDTPLLIDEYKAALAEKEREIEGLTKKVENLTAWYDKMFGTPCEEIRHQQQVEQLQADLDLVKAERDELKYKLQVHADLIGETEHGLRKEIAQLTTDLDQVVGEAVKCVTYLASPYIDDSMRQTAQEAFMGHALVQTWQARQQEGKGCTE